MQTDMLQLIQQRQNTIQKFNSIQIQIQIHMQSHTHTVCRDSH